MDYVKPLNSDTFLDFVMDIQKDVFVLFVGPFCELCDQVWPVFLKAAQALVKTENLQFCTMNMELNEIDDNSINFYPTLRYYPTDSKNRPYDYDGNLDLSELVGFIKRVKGKTI